MRDLLPHIARFLSSATGRSSWIKTGLAGIGVALLTAAAFGSGSSTEPASPPGAIDSSRAHIVFVIGEQEYDTQKTLPAFARNELAPRGFQLTFVHADPDAPNTFPGLEKALAKADLLFLSVRRRALPREQLAAIRQYLSAGKPLAAIRTSSHAFALREGNPPPEHATWPDFDVEVLGGRYENHYGNDSGTAVHIRPQAARHPILSRIRLPSFHSGGTLYRSRALDSTTTVLLTGQATVDGKAAAEPVAWTNTYHGGRVFYTSLGHPSDFDTQPFRRLLTNAVHWALEQPPPGVDESMAGNADVAQYMRSFEGRGELSDASPYKPPREALKTFTLPEDLNHELVAAEPTIYQPVEIHFDHRGRLWVVQYNQYPYPEGLKVTGYDYHLRAQFDSVPAPPPARAQGADRITMLEDTDHDGTFDKAWDVITGLNIATSVVLGRGGVWVLNPPYLLKYPDPDGDGVPNGEPEVHLEGFGLQDTHSVASSLRWGPDGWLYGASGSTTIDTVSSAATKDVGYEGQAIWRYHPATKVFELFAEGGGNTFHVEFDAEGRLYSGHNGGDARAFHYKQGAYYRKNWGKHGALTNPYAFGYFPHMNHTGNEDRFTHAEVVYEGSALPPRYQGKLISVNSLQNRIQVSRMEPKGSTFETVDIAPLVETTDDWYRPVDIKVGPDGAVYVADWYDDRLTHVDPRDTWHRASGRIYRTQKKDAAPAPPFDLSKRSTEELIATLSHPNKWFRQKALRIFGDRKDTSATPVLKKLIRENAGQLALDALWALNLSGGFDEKFAAALGLPHPNPHVRRWTVRLLGDRRNVSAEMAAALAGMAQAESKASVRSQLAASARRMPAADALPILRALLGRAEDADDPHIPLQLWWALESKAESARPAVLRLFEDSTLWDEPIVRRTILDRLVKRYVMAGGSKNFAAAARLFELAPAGEVERHLIAGLQEGLQGSDVNLPELPLRLRTALRQYQERLDQSGLAVGLQEGQAEAIEKALAVVADRDADRTERLEYLRILKATRPPQAVPVLLRLITNSTPSSAPFQRAALRTLAGYDKAQIGEEVAEAYPNDLRADPEVRAAALKLLVSRRNWALELLEAIGAKRIDPAEIPAHLVQQMRLHEDPNIGKKIDKQWPSTQSASSAEKQQRMQRVAEILKSGQGDPEAGRPIFMSTCGSCHKLYGEGGNLGPDLTGYDRDNTSYMVLQTVSPSASVREGYVNYVVETKGGRTLTGFVAGRSGKTVTLQSLSGQKTTIAESRIANMRALPVSIMPEGLLKPLSKQEIRDLFAYLKSAKPPRTD